MMLTHALFYLMLSFFLVHELDAAMHHEWRVLPLTSRFPDQIGRLVFIWAHIPLLMAIFWLMMPDPDAYAGLCLSAFAVLHVGLHWLYRKHPAYEFNNFSSWALIIGAGILGASHLCAVLFINSGSVAN